MCIVREHRLQRDSFHLVSDLSYSRCIAIVLQGHIVPCIYFRNIQKTKVAFSNRSDRYVRGRSALVSATITQHRVKMEMKGERIIFLFNPFVRGWDSSVGIATRYAMDGSGIESRWRRDFPHPSRPALGPIQSPIQ